MKQIFITSSGFLRRIIREEILKYLPTKRPLNVAYIPTASKVVKDDSYAKKDIEILKKLGFNIDEIDIAEVKHEELEKRLSGKDLIYVMGGNPYYLLKHVHESGFDKMLPKFINQGVIYVGKSAGGYILAPKVEVPEWFESNWKKYGVTDLTGINIIPFIWVAHYSSERLEDIKKGMINTQYKVRALTNDQAFYITDNDIKIIGDSEEIMLV